MLKDLLKILFSYSPCCIKKKIEYVYSFIPSSNIFWKYKWKIGKSQWYNQEKLKELQIKKLRILIRHVYENVPYYHKIFQSLALNPSDINTINDLSKLPILTKEDIKKNFEDLKAKNFKKFHSRFISTSGSTGEPLGLYIDEDKFKITGAFNSRHLSWIGYEQWQKRAFIRYSIRSLHKGGVKESFRRFFSYKDNILELQIDRVSGNEAEILEKLQEFKPEVITSTPSAFFFLAMYMREKKINNLQPRAIVTTSEILFSSQRRIIEEQFKCRVFDCYWSSEFVAMAHECSEGNLHLDTEYGIIEFLNSKGERVNPGDKGFVVATQFDNFAMPLIRYNTGDIAVLSPRICPCGRKLPLIFSLEGRREETVVTKNGNIIERLDPGFGHILGVKLCQIVQKQKGQIIVKVVKNSDYSETSRIKLIETLQKQIDGEMEIEIEFVPDIYPTKTGKYQFLITKVPIEL